MKSTRLKILKNATSLFNRGGVGNTRLQDIAQKCGISSGNLSYHYKTKKDLMEAVLELMSDQHNEMSIENKSLMTDGEYLEITKNYLSFQINHRFFQRDILEIIKLVPDAKDLFESQMNQMIEFTKNGLYLSADKGLIDPEPHTNHFYFFAKNIWGILNSWLIEREVFGEEKVSMENILIAIWEFHYPYFTEKGLKLFQKLKAEMRHMIKEEITGAI